VTNQYTEIPKIYGTYIAPREKEKIDTYTYKEAGRRSKRAQQQDTPKKSHRTTLHSRPN